MSTKDDTTRLLDIQELIVMEYEIKADEVILICKNRFDYAVCPDCGNISSTLHENTAKSIRDVSIFGKRCFIHFTHRRFYCRECRDTFMERLSFLNPDSIYTNRYEQYIYELCRENSVSFVSRFECLGYDATEGIYYRQVSKKLTTQEDIEILGIDEISMRKGHKDYVLVISDIGNKRVLEVLKDRRKESLDGYFDEMPAEMREKIKKVSIDMWSPYYDSVREKLPHAEIVVDRFHVMKNLNDCLTSARREISRDLSKEDKEKVKGSRWILVKNMEDLSPEELGKLNVVYETSEELKKTHVLKEDFRRIFEEEDDRQMASELLSDWVKRVIDSGLKCLEKFLTTLSNWKESILNYFDGKVTNGFVEGMNNKIKLIKRKGFGFTNHKHFRCRILDSCGSCHIMA
ncbi:ISL3 family transposase [Candidatus Poribacteria bacterium]|nr:ISL3 family transposase [Candidatus Poribacteria bacterium]